MKQKINKIEIPDGKRAEWVNGVLTLVDDKPKDVTERIKTFEDACAELGDKHPFVIQYKEIYNCFLDGAAMSNSYDIVAYLKLRIVCAALNEGWEPQFTDGEYRYYPWYYIQDKDTMSEDERKECIEIPDRYRLPLLGGCAYNGTDAGLVCSDSDWRASDSNARVGSRLCLKTSALAEYAGLQFSDLWFDFCLIRK